jgi:hypothetical protein
MAHDTSQTGIGNGRVMEIPCADPFRPHLARKGHRLTPAPQAVQWRFVIGFGPCRHHAGMGRQMTTSTAGHRIRAIAKGRRGWEVLTITHHPDARIATLGLIRMTRRAPMAQAHPAQWPAGRGRASLAALHEPPDHRHPRLAA